MPQKINAVITGVGGYVPEYRLTNKELEMLVETNDEWIKTRTGVEERRILKGEGKATSDLGAPAVLDLCQKKGITRLKLMLLFVAQLLQTCFFLLLPTLSVKK